MTYTIIWELRARQGLEKLRAQDTTVASAVTRAVNQLARDPEPPSSSKLGGTGFRRLRIGEYRVTYEIDGINIAIKVLMVGKVTL
ncbi:type II toxin-antitoxin system RelE/ParE family toxin [Streptomyces sp. AV19]|uniref:type II toxin-antitoxin system RelE family toxin n=1 Tax=Streptomyces sp. AV19 TaxID=2793068 RepID=UPI0018FE7DA6|nr:type II toxin-antitoxin system RelE/ParE family toxin [Streptomyces sp. AV19]MBH1938407.1 type II toxin-antitoxin system RelE/ParE family toxin [Streptomyces sp. AV19]MDG4535056.1 type II toxin-antitoxin system RelE/ParE family toxin [Streptomyces sp. AV19]